MSKFMGGRGKYLLGAGVAVFCAAMLLLVCKDGGAPPAAGPYTLTITQTAGGNVTKYPDKEVYVSGEQVEIIATPDNDHNFSNWSSGLTGSKNPETVTVTRDMSISANFTPKGQGFVLNVSPSAGGNVTKEPDKGVYNSGEQVVITAIPASTHRFIGWSGDVTSTTPTYTVTVTRDMNIGATFQTKETEPPPQSKFTVTLLSSPGGELNKYPDKTEYDLNEQVTITALPGVGLKFKSWSGVTGSENPITVTITKDISVGAVFELDEVVVPPGGDGPFNLTVNINPPGAGSVTPEPMLPADGEGPIWGPYAKGTAVTLLYPTANDGYDFLSWGGAGTGSFNRTVIMNSAQTVIANFEAIGGGGQTYSLNLDIAPVAAKNSGKCNVTQPATGSGDGLGSYTYDVGTSITVTASGGAPYVFNGWRENNVQVHAELSYTFTLTGSRNLVASFIDTTTPDVGTGKYCRWDNNPNNCYGIGGPYDSTKTEAECVAKYGEVVENCQADAGQTSYCRWDGDPTNCYPIGAAHNTKTDAACVAVHGEVVADCNASYSGVCCDYGPETAAGGGCFCDAAGTAAACESAKGRVVSSCP